MLLQTDVSHFFIFGNPRSGTTLLRLMLNSHEDLCVPPECGFVDWLLEDFKEVKISEEQYGAFAAAVSKCKKFETWGLATSNIEAALKAMRPTSYRELCFCVYLAYSKKIGKQSRVLGDKNNYYIKNIAKLDSVFPSSKKLFIVRDGRDVACSYLNLASKTSTSRYFPQLPSSIPSIAYEWKKNARTAMKYEATAALVVRYEDLLVNTQATLEAVCGFLEVRYSNAMMTYNTKNDEPEKFLEWKPALVGPLKKNNYGQYKTCLTAKQVEDFEDIAGDALAELGYL